jgi:hypothetical protein
MSNVTILHPKEALFNRQCAERFLTLLDESTEALMLE